MKSRLIALILSVALIPMTLLVCGCTSSVSNNLIPENYSIYSNKSYGFTIQYPNEWAINESIRDKIVVFYPPGSNVSDPEHASLEMRLERIGASDRSPPGLYDLYQFGIHEAFAMAPLRGVNSSISAPVNSKLGGLPALSMNYTWTENGHTLKGIIIYTIKSTERDDSASNASGYLTTYYVLEYSAGEDRYDAYLNDVLRMIDSFKRT